MELIPYGIHHMYNHEGGCSEGMWTAGTRHGDSAKKDGSTSEEV